MSLERPQGAYLTLSELPPIFSHPQLRMWICRNTNAWEAGVGSGEDFWGDK